MFPFDFLREPLWQPLTWTLLHFLWQGLVIVVMVTILRYLLPIRRAQHRYLVNLAALMAMAICPVATFILLDATESSTVASHHDSAIESAAPIESDPKPTEMAHAEPPANPIMLPAPENGVSPETIETIAIVPVLPDTSESMEIVPDPAPAYNQFQPYITAIQPYALILWIVGILFFGARLLISWLHVRWLRWGCQSISDELAATAVALSKRLGLRFPPRVYASEKIREAIVVGLWRPLVLLPTSWLTLVPPEVLEAVIAHELAHIRRFDLWVNLLQRLMETILFYHPAVWYLSRRVSVEREMCADDLAVCATKDRLLYVTALERLGRMRLSPNAPRLGTSIGGNKMALLNRVGNLLGLSAPNKKARWWPVGLLTIAIPLMIWLVSMNFGSPAEHKAQAEPPSVEKAEEKDDSMPVEPKDEEKDKLKWGPVHNGLQLAVELLPKKETYLLGETIDVRFHVRNTTDSPVQISLESSLRQEMYRKSVLIHDEHGKPITGQPVLIWVDGDIATQQVTVEPGKTFSYDSSDLAFCTPKQQPKAGVGYWVKAGPGVYTVKFKQSFPFGYIDFNPHEWGYPSIGIGDDIFSWKGVLETVPVTIKIAEEDSQDASPEKISEKFPHANPLGLDDETLIKLFNTGKALRRVGFDCESHYSEHKRLPKDIPDLAKRYEERSRHNIGNDPFAPGKKLHLVPVPNQPKKIRIWSVGPDGDWDGGRRIDSTKKPLDGDIGLECDLSQRGGTGGTFLADDTIIQCMQGLRLAHYLAAKGKKFPKPELKDDGLAWGPVVDGLQLAVELKPKRDFYYLGETIDVRFHIRNAADYAIQVGLTMHMKQDMGDGSVFIENEEGKRLKSKSVWMSGGVFTKQQVLKPGETATYESSNLAFLAPGKKPGAGAVGCWVEAGPGVYTVRFKQHFTDYFRADARQWNGELETGTVKVRIAKDPKFAIHLVKGYRHAGEGGPTSVTTYFFHNNNYKDKKYRLDTLKPENYPLKDLVLDGTPLVTEADLLAYDWDHHVMYLKPEAYKRLAKFKPNVWGVPFLVQSEGKPVYLGAFWSIISSYSADMPTINLSPLKYKAPENVPSELAKYAVQIRNSCISKPDQLPRDPRQSGRLQRALTEAGKISLKDAEELPHGEPVKKIQTRLRYGGTNYNDKSWFHFDLRNDSKDYTVPLGPAGIPTDILVDGVTYHWSGRVAGQLPICKPGQRVHEACFALDKDWSTKDKKGKLKQLDLTPGRHTIQAIIYAEGPPMFGRPNKVKVLSNLVEFEFTQPRSERTAWGKTVDGLQLGLVFESDSNPVFHAGETVHLGLFVRNTGKSPKQLAYLSRVAGTGFTLRDAEGNLIPISLPTIDIKALLQHQFLPPGRTVGLEDIHLELGEKSTSAKNPHVSLQPGKYRIGQTFSFHNASDVDFSGKLTSGELELVVAKPKSEASAEAKKLMQDPQAVAPQVKIQVEFPGHSPTEVEQLITTPLEKMLSQIDGVVSFDSVSRKDRVIITVRYKAGEDREQSLAELKKKINENGDLFPLGVASWVVKPVKSDSSSQSEHKKAAWGKPVEGVQSRLRPDDVHNSEPSFYFDLRNKSSNFSVQLGPNGRPIEILVDGTAYVWGTGIAGSLPVCKPGENSMGVQVKLNRNWVTKTIKGLPKTLAIKPGHHTVQAVVYAEGPDKRGRPQKMQVLSNAVEIEVPSEKETKEVASNVLTSGETVPSAQPSAKSSCFTLYRVKGYYPSKDHEKAAAIYFDGDKEKRFDPMQLEHYPLENLILDKKPLVTESDILSYDWDRHVILLKPEVHKRLA
ncbi:MAG: efflux RND transporter permease subunit, partial [Planctomycetia bacterium]